MIWSAAGSWSNACVGGFQVSPSTPSLSHRLLSPDDVVALIDKTLRGIDDTHDHNTDLFQGLLNPICQYVGNSKLAEWLAKKENKCENLKATNRHLQK